MKKILEKIKQKWSEYLLEILVIMIGVLGAFMLNGWNEQRKERIAEKEVLNNLALNLEKNIKNLEDHISDLHLWDQSSGNECSIKTICS